MKKSVFLIIVILTIKLVICDQLYPLDTLYFYKSVIINNKTEYTDYYNVELLETDKIFDGYLVIQLDSNLYRKKSSLNDSLNCREIIFTTVYWVKSLEDITNDSMRYYYNPSLGLIADGELYYSAGKRDELSIFIYYYNLFNWINKPNDNSYLYYNRHALTTESLKNQILWTEVNSENSYVVFHTVFHTAVLKFINNNRKFFIPTSRLLLFKPEFTEDMINQGFTKSNKIVLIR